MIQFQDLDNVERRNEYKSGKNRLKCLEENLRLLGNFNSDLITVADEDYKYDGERKVIYTVYDLDQTAFQFYNYMSQEHCQLIMKRKSSQNTYIYDFRPYDCQKLGLAEIHRPLSKFRTLKLKMNRYGEFGIIIEEQEKEYCLTFDTNFKKQLEKVLKVFESIVTKAKEIEKLNLENILNIFTDVEKVSSCTIKRKNVEIAYLSMKNGEVVKYEIVEPNRTIHVDHLNFERNVERTMDGEVYKTEMIKEPDILQTEYNRILRKL